MSNLLTDIQQWFLEDHADQDVADARNRSLMGRASDRIRELDAIVEKLPLTGDKKPVVFGRNYYTRNIMQEGSPVVGVGVLAIQAAETEDGYVGVTIRTGEGEEFDTYADFLFFAREAAEASKGKA